MQTRRIPSRRAHPLAAASARATALARIVVVALAAATLVACGHAQAPRSTGAAPPPVDAEQAASSGRTAAAPAQPQPQEHPGDARIAEAIRGELAVDPAVDLSAIDVEVTDGVVELRGDVPHLLMADAAVERAEMVHGVRAVIDLLELPRTDRPDAVVQTHVEEALRAAEATDVGELVVRVIDGVVTLRGTADSFAEKRIAERVAHTVRGVRDVVNQIEVEQAAPRADREILSEVQRTLRADRWVDEWLLTPEVDEGIVSLRGVQPTAAAKRRAVNAAWVAGVRGVDATLVDVDPELAPELRRPPAGYAYPEDPEIQQSVRMALARDPRVSRRPIEVAVREGVVVLRGEVSNLDARRAAAETAETVSGVWRVDNLLAIAAPSAPTDAELEQQAQQALSRAAAIDERGVSVQVNSGVVTLTGSVETPYAKMVAEEVIGRIPGVREIESEIEAPARVRPPLSDASLMQNVIAHLEAHPYVDPSQVQVSVANGQVMLRGRVDDWRGERDAIRAAYEAGATSVIEDIEILHGPADGAP